MINVPEQITKFNYDLVAYEMGRAAVDIGTMIVEIPVPAESPSLNLRLVPRFVDPLLRLLAGFSGEPDIAASGLENTSTSRPPPPGDTIREIERAT